MMDSQYKLEFARNSDEPTILTWVWFGLCSVLYSLSYKLFRDYFFFTLKISESQTRVFYMHKKKPNQNKTSKQNKTKSISFMSLVLFIFFEALNETSLCAMLWNHTITWLAKISKNALKKKENQSNPLLKTTGITKQCFFSPVSSWPSHNY